MNLRIWKYGFPAVRQCAAVQAAVCGSAHGGSVCGSAPGSSVWQCAQQCAAAVRQCGSVQQFAAVCSSVWLCARLFVCDSARGGVRQCVGPCVAVFSSKCGSVCAQQYAAVRLAVCGSAWQFVAVPALGAVSVWQQCALSTYILHKVAHNIRCSVTGAVGMSLIVFLFLAYY
jgi:hypothetical protein